MEELSFTVRLARDSEARLEVERARLGRSRSWVMRRAAADYLAPLVAALDRGELDWAEQHRRWRMREVELVLGETVRSRSDRDLLARLDRIEAYARGLGYRHVTRSLLLRRAVDAYVGLMPPAGGGDLE